MHEKADEKAWMEPIFAAGKSGIFETCNQVWLRWNTLEKTSDADAAWKEYRQANAAALKLQFETWIHPGGGKQLQQKREKTLQEKRLGK